MPDSATGPTRGRAAALLAGAVLLLLLSLVPSAPASAHAGLTSSSPADGDVVQTLPSTVQLTFGEPIATPAHVVVTDPVGRVVSTGEPQVVDGVVSQPVAESTAAGEYGVEYRVVSADGHPVSGTLGFTVTSGTEPSDSAAPAQAASDGFWAGRWVLAAMAGAGLLGGIALLGSGLRGRR